MLLVIGGVLLLTLLSGTVATVLGIIFVTVGALQLIAQTATK